MNMKKILLSMILLALCLIQASAGNYYYYKIWLSNENGGPGRCTSYIAVGEAKDGVYANGLRKLLKGETVTDEGGGTCTLPKKADNNVDLDKIYGIVFANGKGKDKSEQEDILPGDEYEAWKLIRSHIKYLELREYIRNTYTGGDSYFAYMHNVEELELPECGMKVGDGDDDCLRYFANAEKLKKILIYVDKNTDKVDITDDRVKDKELLNRVGKFMFSNCYSLSTKYINRLIKDVTEIKDNAFYADDANRNKFSDEADNKIIEIPSSVTKIGNQAFYNRVKVTGLNIQGNSGCLEIGSEAFGQCDELAKIMQTNKELKIYKNAFMRCKQLNAFENLDKAKITYLGTGVFGDCRSMTNEFVNGVLTNYAANGGTTKIPAYLFFGCNGQDGHDGSDGNKNVCSFTDLNIPAQFTEIGDGAFASTGDAKIKLKTITVNSEKAPTCLQGETDEYVNIRNKSVFDGLDPNITTVIFANHATGWKETETETTGFLTYMNDNSEFQRLLTKDLYSNHTEYINVPQQHAIVRLHRTLKEGWNTICLPFGVNNRYGDMWHDKGYRTKQACNARIIVNGLTNNDSGANSDNFRMGVYRGYWPAGKTFMFLHYTNFDEYPLDFGETFLVYMRKQDIENAKKDKEGVDIYTFRNVDLNYSWSADGEGGNDGNWTPKIYTAKEMLQHVKDFDGKVNTDATPFKDKKLSYDDYVLTGSLVQRKGTVGDSQGIITTKDYFFQQSKDGTMKLYPYTADKQYGIRGFSGWFHKIDNSSSKASELSIGLFDDSCITAIETVKVDDLNRDTSGKVYSISGVLVKNDAADLNNLPKGIYVVNGKKYVVK